MLTRVDDGILIVVVREVGVGIAAAPRKLQDDHAGGANGLPQTMFHVSFLVTPVGSMRDWLRRNACPV